MALPKLPKSLFCYLSIVVSNLIITWFHLCVYVLLYSFAQYEAIHPTEDDIYVHRSGMVKRRFREFVNLQLRLEDNPLYKKSLKGLLEGLQ